MLCIEKKIGSSLHFNNSLHLLHFANVIAWEEQSMRKSAWRSRPGLAEQWSFQRALFDKNFSHEVYWSYRFHWKHFKGNFQEACSCFLKQPFNGVFLIIMLQISFLMHYSNFEQIPWKIPAKVSCFLNNVTWFM